MTDGPPPNPHLTVDAVILHEGRVLLIRRGRPPYEGTWALPGGFVDIGETVEAATVREAKEETGLDTVLDRLLGVYSDPARDPRGHTVSVTHLAHPAPDADPETAKGGDDAAEARWFPLDELPALAFDHDRILADARCATARRKTARAPLRDGTERND